MFHNARNGGEPVRKTLRIGNALQLGVEEPVPAIRDESVAVLRHAQRRRPGASRRGGGGFNRTAGGGRAKRRDFNRQREAAEHRYPF